MMIISDRITFDIDFPIKNEKIENEFLKRSIEVLRWSISNIEENKITINYSCNKH